MATPFYIRNAVSDLTSFTSPYATIDSIKLLSLTRGSSVTTFADNTASSLAQSLGSVPNDFTNLQIGWASTTGVNDNNSVRGLIAISNPLNAVTISSTINVNLRAAENNAMANYTVGCWILKYSSGTFTVIGKATFGTELGTTEAAKNFNITPTSTSIGTGDRVAVYPVWLAATGTAVSSGFTASTWYDGPTASASGDAWVSFTETITESTGAVASSYPMHDRRTARRRTLNRI